MRHTHPSKRTVVGFNLVQEQHILPKLLDVLQGAQVAMATAIGTCLRQVSTNRQRHRTHLPRARRVGRIYKPLPARHP